MDRNFKPLDLYQMLYKYSVTLNLFSMHIIALKQILFNDHMWKQTKVYSVDNMSFFFFLSWQLTEMYSKSFSNIGIELRSIPSGNISFQFTIFCALQCIYFIMNNLFFFYLLQYLSTFYLMHYFSTHQIFSSFTVRANKYFSFIWILSSRILSDHLYVCFHNNNSKL